MKHRHLTIVWQGRQPKGPSDRPPRLAARGLTLHIGRQWRATIHGRRFHHTIQGAGPIDLVREHRRKRRERAD